MNVIETRGTFPRANSLIVFTYFLRGDPATKPLLQTRAVQDPDPYPRQTALDNLAQYFYDDPETKPLLHARAVQDPDPGPRAAAINSLARHFRDDPETKPLLQARAVQDPDPSLRQTALNQLATHFRDDPETKTLLYHAVDNESSEVRRAAFLGIAKVLDDPALPLIASRFFSPDWGGGRDPREPITAEIIAEAAGRLGKSEGEVRALFERLAREVKLTIEPPAAMPVESAGS